MGLLQSSLIRKFVKLRNFGAILSCDTNKIELVQCEVFSDYLHIFFVFCNAKVGKPYCEDYSQLDETIVQPLQVTPDLAIDS